MAAWSGWEQQVLRAARLPVSARNVQLLRGWQASEGGTAAFNPLNTTTHASGSTAYNSNGGTPVQNFRSQADGVAATVKTLYNGHYGHIIAALKQGNSDYSTFGQAVDSSPWGTHGGYIREWSGGAHGAPPAPTTAGPQVAAERGQPKQEQQDLQAAHEAGQRQLALQLLQRSNDYLNANGKSIQGPSLADLVHQRQTATAMAKVSTQANVKFHDLTGGASQDNPRVGGVIQLAKQYIGTKYVFGGANPNTGFDCSGFVQYVYGHRGVNLPRTSQEQFRVGQAISPGQLRPGDLLFFAGSDGTVSNPGHEGMYLGNGQMISAPHTGDVVHISNVNLGPGSGYSGARRVAA
jgi:cell wall-associated NlpC family hydrolase